MNGIQADGVAREADKGAPRFDAVHSDALRFFDELVSDLGGDPERLLKCARIDPATLQQRGMALEYRAMVNLFEIAARDLARPDFGLRLAALQGGTRVMGPIGVVMKNSKTLGQALGYCAKQIHAYSLATRVRFVPNREEHQLFIMLEILLNEPADPRQVIEHALSLANWNVIEITGGRARARRVTFRHAPVSSVQTYADAFGCEVHFGERADGIVFDEQDLLRPVIDPDEQVHEMATAFIEQFYPPGVPPMSARVRAIVMRHLGDADCTHERIAAEFCMHPRTLQRRLRGEGTTFEAIKDEVRRDVALRCLQRSDLPLSEVAQRLGYAEQSVLSRSCYRWFAASPRQLREGSPHSAKAEADLR